MAYKVLEDRNKKIRLDYNMFQQGFVYVLGLLEKLRWWDKTPNQIQRIIPLLSRGDIAFVKEEIKCILDKDESV